jgi:hypothetical protein
LISGSSQVSYTGLSNTPAGIVSGSTQVSFNGITDKPALVSSSAQIVGYNVFATTGSNQFNGSQAVTGSLTVTGQVVAQTLNVQQVTSSIVFSSGSNIFGNSLGNTQQFTGSVSVTGSLTVNGVMSLNNDGTYGSAYKTLGFTGNTNGSHRIFAGTSDDMFFAAATGRGLDFRVSGSANSSLYIAATGAAIFSGPTVTIGTAVAATNVKLILNGVTSKAAGIEFHQSGTPQWYIGNGIASEDNNFELYNSNGTMAMKIIKSTNAINFIGAATFSSSVTAKGTLTIGESLVENGIINSPEGIYINADSDASGGSNDIVFGKSRTSTSGGTTFMTIKNGGNVGIGTTIPYSKLEVYTTLGASMGVNHAPDAGTYPRASGIGLGATSTSYTVASGGGTISFVGGAGMYAENTALSGNPTNLVFWTNLAGTPAEQMRINAAGQTTIFGSGNSLFVTSNNNSLSLALGYQGSAHGYIGGISSRLEGYSNNGGYAFLNASSVWVPASDIKRKRNFEEYTLGINAIMGLKPTLYNMDFQEDGDEKQVGFIAQEVKDFIPIAYEENEDFIGLNYNAIIVTMVKAIQELKSENDNLKSRLEVLEQS